MTGEVLFPESVLPTMRSVFIRDGYPPTVAAVSDAGNTRRDTITLAPTPCPTLTPCPFP